MRDQKTITPTINGLRGSSPPVYTCLACDPLIVPKVGQMSNYAFALLVDYVCDIPRRVFDIQCAGSWLDFRQYPNVLFLRFCF